MAINRLIGCNACVKWLKQPVIHTLMISFSMIMRNILGERPTKRRLAE